MKSSGFGRIIIAQGVSMWIGEAGEDTDTHAHHAVQITLGLSGKVRFKSAGEQWQPYSKVLISPHHSHAFSGAGVWIAHIFVEPESSWGQLLLSLYGDVPLVDLPDESLVEPIKMLKQAYKAASDDLLKRSAEAVVESLTRGHCQAEVTDSRILQSLAHIESRLSQSVTLTDIADAVHLSPGRFRHLFVQETGLTFRTYVLWLRLRRAVELIARGHALTSAAHAAGFADASHLSRTFRRMFGVAPASLHKC